MYIPKIHKGLSQKSALDFAKKYSFAVVNSIVNLEIESSHIPLELEERDEKLYISGHVAKGNTLSKAILEGNKTTCIFSQPHAYVSSSWYDHVNVPTWNYIAIHMKGYFNVLTGTELLSSLHKMVDHYEESRKERYRISDMPEDMLLAHLNGLTGFEIEVQEIETNFKLSQNRNDKDYANIISQLLESNNSWEKDIAEEMLRLRTHLNE